MFKKKNLFWAPPFFYVQSISHWWGVRIHSTSRLWSLDSLHDSTAEPQKAVKRRRSQPLRSEPRTIPPLPTSPDPPPTGVADQTGLYLRSLHLRRSWQQPLNHRWRRILSRTAGDGTSTISIRRRTSSQKRTWFPWRMSGSSVLLLSSWRVLLWSHHHLLLNSKY